MPSHLEDAEIEWMGNSKKVLSSWPVAIPQPRVSELLNGKLGQKSLEKLLIYAGRLGIEHRGSFTQVHKNVPKKELAMAQA